MNALVLFLMVFGVIVAPVLAAQKNRNVVGWGVFGFFLPVIAIVAIACLPAKQIKQIEQIV